MYRRRDDRFIAARELVLALGSGLNRREPIANDPFDGAIIAELEMQERPVFDGSPIASVKCVAADEIERSGNRPATIQGEFSLALRGDGSLF